MVLRNYQGFSLIEVISALAIISVILLSFFQIFVLSNKTSVTNNEKLVAINLADAALATVQAKTYIKTPNEKIEDLLITDDSIPKKFIINGKTYMVSYKSSQEKNKVTNANFSEKDLNLEKVVVQIIASDGKFKGSSEGYVQYENQTVE